MNLSGGKPVRRRPTQPTHIRDGLLVNFSTRERLERAGLRGWMLDALLFLSRLLPSALPCRFLLWSPTRIHPSSIFFDAQECISD